MARLRDSPDNLFALVGRTADALRLPAEFVEKDYWITETLRSVARPMEGAEVVFKGGTSLSKGHGLIERFSEDVDILYEELFPLEIRVLHPQRTLFEKLAALHHLASGFPASGMELRRAARHLYDVFRLLTNAGVRESLGRSAKLAEEVAADMATVSREWEWPHAPRPEGGYAASPAFDPNHPSQAILAAGLEDTRALIVGKMPTIEDCRRAVREAADLL